MSWWHAAQLIDVAATQEFPVTSSFGHSLFVAAPYVGSPLLSRDVVGNTGSNQHHLIYTVGVPAPTVGSAVNGRTSAVYDPAASDGPSGLGLDGWWEGSYTGDPWTPSSGSGASGTNGNLTNDTVHVVPTTGTAVNTFTPALLSSGSGTVLVSATAASSFMTTSAFFVSVLFKTPAFGTIGGGGSGGWLDAPVITTTQNDWGIVCYDNGSPNIAVATWIGTNGTSGTYTPVINVTGNTWCYICAYYDGTTLSCRVYRGGTTTTQSVSAGNIPILGSKMQIGWNGASNWIDGNLMSVMTKKTTLTTAQMDSSKAWLATRYPAMSL